MIADAPDEQPAGPTFVGDCVAAIRDDTPAPIRTVRGVIALPGMVLLWFFPKSMGVRLSAAGWSAAGWAHVFGIVVGGGLILWAEVFFWSNPAGMTPVTAGMPNFITYQIEYPAPAMTVGELLRAPFAALVMIVHAVTINTTSVTRLLWLILAIEGVTLILSGALLPFAAAGEHKRVLFVRCIRLVWWSTTLFIPLGIGWLLDPYFRRWMGLTNEWHILDYTRLSVFILWWVIVMQRSGLRYSGEPIGPAWEPRVPECERCGYNLAGLPIDGNCPECGHPNAMSLPQHRHAPFFAEVDGPIRFVAGALKAFRATMAERDYFARLSVHRMPTKDRQYFGLVCVATAVVVGIGVGWWAADEWTWYSAVIAGCLSYSLQVILAGAIATILAVFGRRPLLSASIVVFNLWSYVLIAAIGFMLFVAGATRTPSLTTDYECVGWTLKTLGILLLSAVLLSTGGILTIIAAYRFVRSIRQTRRATG